MAILNRYILWPGIPFIGSYPKDVIKQNCNDVCTRFFIIIFIITKWTNKGMETT